MIHEFQWHQIIEIGLALAATAIYIGWIIADVWGKKNGH